MMKNMGKKNRSRKKKSPPKDGAAQGAAPAAAAIVGAAGDASASSGACCAPPPRDVAAAASMPAALFAPAARASKQPDAPTQASKVPCQKPLTISEHVTESGTVLSASAGVRIEAAPVLCCPDVKQVTSINRAGERAASADSALSPPPAAAASGGKKKKRGRKKPQSDSENAPEGPMLQKACPRTKPQTESQQVQVCPITKNLSTSFKEAEPMEVEGAATCTCPHPVPMPPGSSKKRNKKKGKSPPKESVGVVPMQGIIEQPQATQPELPEPKPAAIAGVPPASMCEKPMASPPVGSSSPAVKKPSPPPSSRKRPRVKVDEVAIEIVATDVCSSKTLGLSWDDVAFNDLQEMCSQSDDKMEEETVSQILKGVELLESGSSEMKEGAPSGKAMETPVMPPAEISPKRDLTSVPIGGEVMAVPPPVPHCPQVDGQQAVAVVQTPETKPVVVDDDMDDDCCMDFGDAFLSDIACEHTTTPAATLDSPQQVETLPAPEPPQPVAFPPATETPEPVASPPAPELPQPVATPPAAEPAQPVAAPPSPAVGHSQPLLAEAPVTVTVEEPATDIPPHEADTLSPKGEQVKFGSLSFADVVKRPRTISEAEREKLSEETKPAEAAPASPAPIEVDVYDVAVERAVWCYLHEEGQRMQIYQQAELAESHYQQWLCSSAKPQQIEPWMQACPYMMGGAVTNKGSLSSPARKVPADTEQNVTARYMKEEAEKMEVLTNAANAEASYFAKQSQQMMQEKPKARRSPVKLVCDSPEKVTPNEQIASNCLREEVEKMSNLANATRAEARYFEQFSKQVTPPTAEQGSATSIPCELASTDIKDTKPASVLKPAEKSDDDDFGGLDLGDAFLADVPCEQTTTPVVKEVKLQANQKPVEESDDDDDDFGGIDLGDAFLADIPCELTSTPVAKAVEPPMKHNPDEDSDEDFGGIDLGDAFLADVPCEQTSTPAVREVKPPTEQMPGDENGNDIGGMEFGNAFLADVSCEQTSTPVVKDVKPTTQQKPEEDSDDDDFGGIDLGDAFLADVPCEKTTTPLVKDEKPPPDQKLDEESDDDFGGIDLGDAFLADVPCEQTTTPCIKEVVPAKVEKPSVPEPVAIDDDDIPMDLGDAFLADVTCEHTTTAPPTETPVAPKMDDQVSSAPKSSAKRPIESDDDDDDMAMDLGDAFLCDIPCELTSTPVSEKPAAVVERKPADTKVDEPVAAQTVVPLHRAPAPVESDSDDEMDLGDAFLVDVPCEKTTTPVAKKLNVKTDLEDSFDLEMEPFPVRDPTYYDENKVETPQSTPQSPGEYLLAKTIKEEDEDIITKELKERKHLAELGNYLADSAVKMELLKNAVNSERKYQESVTSQKNKPFKPGQNRDRRSSDRSTPDSGHRMAIVEVEEVGIQTTPQKSPVILAPLRKSYKEALETPVIQRETVECQTETATVGGPVTEGPTREELLVELAREKASCVEFRESGLMLKNELDHIQQEMGKVQLQKMTLEEEVIHLKSEVNLQSKFAEEYKQRNKVVESELTASRQKILKLEDDLQKAIAFQSGMDLMLDAKMASDRAKDAESKSYALQTELTSAHIQIKQLTEKLVELTRDRGDMVPACAHQDALNRAEARAQEAEYQVMRLQNELLQIRGLAEVCLTPDSPPPAHAAEGSGTDWPSLGESASRVTWAGVASRGIPPETTIDIADLPSTEIRGFSHDTLNVSSFDQSKSPGVTPELSTGEESDWSSSVDSDPVVGPPSLMMRKHATEGSTSSDQAGAVGDPDPGDLVFEGAARMKPAIPPKPPGLGKIAGRSGASGKSEKSGKPKVPPKPTISRRPRPDNHESTTPTDVGGEVSSSFDEV